MAHTRGQMVRIAAGCLCLGVGCAENETPVPLPATSTEHPAPWDPSADYLPGIEAQDLSTELNNVYFPARVGARWVYEGQSDEGLEHIEVEVLDATFEVWGVQATVIRDTVQLDGTVIEDTWDWYAQDHQKNVWYLGEDTTEFRNGAEFCKCGAWEAGIDGALPGIVFPGEPHIGDAYRQEYLAGVAEDLSEIVASDLTVQVPAGDFVDCIKTRETTPLERDVEEFKYWCAGIGLVLEEEGDERVELISFSGL